jgi:hypothetical protein
MNVSVVITVAMVNAVKEFCALWDNIYDYVCSFRFCRLDAQYAKISFFLHVMYKKCQSSLELMCKLSDPGSSEIAFEY